MVLDPLSILVGVPVLGPIVAWLLKDSRDQRVLHDKQLADQRGAHVAQVDRLQAAYQELAGKVQDNFSRVVAENTAATKGLEKAVDGLVRLHERMPPGSG